MRGYKKVLAVLLSAALLPAPAVGGSAGMTGSVEVKAADMEPEAQYESDVTKLQYVTPVEDQGGSDKCWAYMANAVLESYLKKTEGVSANFSESDMPDRKGATGGVLLPAVAYWVKGENWSSALSDYYVTDVTDLGAYKLDNKTEKETYLQNIKYLVKTYGAAGVSVDFPFDTRAGYIEKGTGAFYKPYEGVNHGVAIVGWDDNYSRNHFKAGSRPLTDGAFLVKNSWGNDEYSENKSGYFWMSYENEFTHAFAIRGVTSRKDLYETVYESGADGLAKYVSSDDLPYTSPGYQAKAEGQYLTAIATYVRAGYSYQFSVTGNDAEQAVTELKTADSAPFQADGYHVFEIQNPVPISGAFYITVKTVPGNGNSDIKPIAENGETCIKVFAKALPAEVPAVPTVAAKAGSRILQSGDWVNEEVTFTVSGGMDNAGYEYAVGSEENWQEIAGNAFTWKPVPGRKTTVYIRAKNPLQAGAVSPSARFEVGYDTVKPVISADITYEPRTDGAGVIVYVTGIEETLSGLAGYYISEDGGTPAADAAWTVLDEKAQRFTFDSEKDTVYYVWVKDRAGNISDRKEGKVQGAVTVDTVTIHADSDRAPRGSFVRLSAAVSGKNNPSQAVTWSVSGARDADTGINEQGELTVGCGESAQELTVTAASAADGTKSASYQIFPVAAQSEITQVSVTPANIRVPNGGSQTFRAAVYGTSQPAPLVTWNIWGQQMSRTYISNDGTLHVAQNETADIIYVRAASKLDSTKSETVTITVGRAYTIVASSGAGGTISPLGSDSYQRGVSAVYTVFPYSGYRIADVKVDGVSVMSNLVAVGSGTGDYSYTFDSVTQSHTITASFTTSAVFTVTFVSDGKVCKTERVGYGGSATAPELTKEGYRLSWDRSFTNVTSDLQVQAVWMYAMADASGSGSASGDDASSSDSGTKTVETVRKMIFTLNSGNGKAVCSKNSAAGKKQTKIVIPTTISAGNNTYSVVSVSADCFKKNTTLRSVTIGRDVQRIGSAAFYGCKNLKTIAIKSTKVTAIGSRAFQKIAKNAIIYVPRSRLTKYRSMIRASGNTTARVRAYN